MSGARVSASGDVPASGSSQLALASVRLGVGEAVDFGDSRADTLLLVVDGDGVVRVGSAEHTLAAGAAALVAAGEAATLTAGAQGLAAARASVHADVDLHAPMGERETVVAVDGVDAASATGKRSFQVLFGPHNGCVRATLFVGRVPPGAAPWHYHLYDEIVWIWNGAGRLHLRGGVEPLAAGSAFRLSPREVHVVENTGADDLVVVGLFTPAGSPSAAYLAPDADAAAYAIEAAS